MNLMGSAATMWQTIIQDPWTIDVDVRWQVPPAGNNFSGQHLLQVEQNGRVKETIIVMNPNRV